MNSHEVFIHIHQGCFAGTGAIVRLPQCQWSKPDGYGKISQCITTTKHSKAKTVCIFLGIYCMRNNAQRHRYIHHLNRLMTVDISEVKRSKAQIMYILRDIYHMLRKPYSQLIIIERDSVCISHISVYQLPNHVCTFPFFTYAPHFNYNRHVKMRRVKTL